VVINPFVVCGPSHTSAVNDSIEVFRSLLTGRYPAIMQLCWGFVDVRDVARAHIAAMETPAAKGRYICANVVLNMRQLVEKLSARFPGYKYPSVSMENALGNGLVKLGSFFQPGQIGSYLRTHLGRVVAFDNSKIKRELQMEFTDIDKSIDGNPQSAFPVLPAPR
jgi:dihydroflavonol-4-reductase